MLAFCLYSENLWFVGFKVILGFILISPIREGFRTLFCKANVIL